MEELEDAERQDNGQGPSEEPEKTKSSNKKVYMLQTHSYYAFLTTKSLSISFGS